MIQFKRTNRHAILLTSAALIALVAGVAAHAEETATFIAEQKPTEYLAKDRLIGAKVHDNDGKIIGDIEDLIVGNDDRVVGVIMGVGGVLGLGEKKVGVTTSALSLEVTDGKMHVVMPAATKDALTSAPAYKRVAPKKGLYERAVEKGMELRDKSAVTAQDALDAAKEKSGPAYEAAKKRAQEVIDSAKQAAQPTSPSSTAPTAPAPTAPAAPQAATP